MDSTNVTYKLPVGWLWTTLGKILFLEYGKSLPQQMRIEGGGYPVYGSNGRIGYHNDYLVEGPVIIVGRKGSVGMVHFEKDNCWPIDTTYYIKCVRSLNIKFVFYLLKQLNLDKLDKSTAIPGINRENVYEKPILLPPLNEQCRIVAKVEELFSELDYAEEGLKKTQGQLSIYRRALLKKAFLGELSVRRKKKGKFPTSWKRVKFNDFCELQRGYDLPLSKIVSGKYPVVTSSGINGYHNQYKAKGPCLITGRSGNVGSVYYVDTDYYWPHNTVLFVKDFRNNSPRYVYYYFLQFDFRSYSSSTAVPTLDRKKLYNAIVSVPTLRAQRQIVQELETKFSVLDNLKEVITTNLQKIASFRISILTKAFAGSLVSQNREDEDAHKLLQRIQIEKEDYLNAEKKSQKKVRTEVVFMEKDKAILEILKESDSFIEAETLWLKSKYREDIDGFYAELKKIEDELIIETKGKRTLVRIKK
jgi:type I restriction enzyme, S subunit